MLIHHNYIIILCKHTIKHMEDFTKLPNTYHSLLRVLLRNSINHNLPPQKNRDHIIYFSNALLSSSFFSFSRSFLSSFLCSFYFSLFKLFSFTLVIILLSIKDGKSNPLFIPRLSTLTPK